jgi:hypothetical protein
LYNPPYNIYAKNYRPFLTLVKSQSNLHINFQSSCWSPVLQHKTSQSKFLFRGLHFIFYVCYIIRIKRKQWEDRCKFGFRFMVFNVTFNNISVISWRSVLLVEETGVPLLPGEKHCQALSHNVVSSTPPHEWQCSKFPIVNDRVADKKKFLSDIGSCK